MRYRIDEPVFTSVLSDVAELRPRSDSLYITGTSVEERSAHTELWERSCENVTFARLANQDALTATFIVDDEHVKIPLRSARDIRKFLTDREVSAVYLDITGLPHHVWAPLLRGIRMLSLPAFGVYVEPSDYKFSDRPTETTIFDLSEDIQGIAPLPGFVSLSSAADEDELFVPLLGFEGARFAHVVQDVQPRQKNTCPIIGVPGFRPEYPFYTYLGNRLTLSGIRAWQNVRFAPANCPFSLYHVLVELAEALSVSRMKIAPIGTKPHAVGAVLYYLDYPSNTEIIYDHPVRKPKRTVGASRVCLYDFSRLPSLTSTIG
jgi:hypothetical protein